MTKVNDNGQLEWTFEELDLYAEFNRLYNESNRLLAQSTCIKKNANNIAVKNNRFVLSDEWKRMKEQADSLYFESRKLYEVSQLIYALWVRGENNG